MMYDNKRSFQDYVVNNGLEYTIICAGVGNIFARGGTQGHVQDMQSTR